jgi:hypothetical protein
MRDALTFEDTSLRGPAWPRFGAAPGRFLGTALLVFLRLFYGLFFFQAGMNKMLKGWGYASHLRDIFTQRLTELNPESFASLYLENFGIPFATPISFVVAYGELFAGIGGYYDASLLPFFAINIATILWPLGRKFGLDRWLARRYPASPLFR